MMIMSHDCQFPFQETGYIAVIGYVPSSSVLRFFLDFPMISLQLCPFSFVLLHIGMTKPSVAHLFIAP